VLAPDKQASPLEFLLMPTPLPPDKTQREAKVEQDKQRSKTLAEDPRTQTPLKAQDPKTRIPTKTAQTKPDPRDPKSLPPDVAKNLADLSVVRDFIEALMFIPPDAAKTGDLSFLEGCWCICSSLPDAGVAGDFERFCFDKNGNGKHTLETRSRPGVVLCASNVKAAGFDAQGRLILTFGQGDCTDALYAVCEPKTDARASVAAGKPRDGAVPQVNDIMDKLASGSMSICTWYPGRYGEKGTPEQTVNYPHAASFASFFYTKCEYYLRNPVPEHGEIKIKLGAPLRIPPGAAKTGDLLFLDGSHWRVTRPDYTGKYAITERFSLDKRGEGIRKTIEDPRHTGKCAGSVKAGFDAQGRLIAAGEQGYCTKGAHWEPASMICEGEGDATSCFWRFPEDGETARRHKISVVLEVYE